MTMKKEISRRNLLKTAGYAAGAVAMGATSVYAAARPNPEAVSERPNFLILFTDDQGFGDLGLHDNVTLETPNMDALARESVQFSNFFVQPCCAPSRAALLTGRNPHEVGVWGVHMGREYLNLDEPLFSEVLLDAGYRTFMAGKWHSGIQGPWAPWNRGFEDAYVGGYHQKKSRICHNSPDAKPFEGWERDVLIEHCVDFMKEHKDEPFLAYMPFFTPHTPWVAPERLIEKYKANGLSDQLSLYNAYTEHLDEGIGTLLKELDRLGLAENTVVIFMSDNGPTKGPNRSEEDWALRNPQGFRGEKGDIWDLGIRSPLFVRWPEKFKPQTVAWNTCIEDIYPTLLELGGAAIPDGKKLSGKSILPLLKEGQGAAWSDRMIMREHFDPHWTGKEKQHDLLLDHELIRYEDQSLTIRNQRFKLCKVGPTFEQSDRNYEQAEGYERGAHYQLYDIQNDPQESTNVSAEHPELFEEMKQKLRDWYEPIMNAPDAFTKPFMQIGYPEKENQLKADAVSFATGSLKRGMFNTMPQWTEAGDSISLNVEVLKKGDYKVRLHGRGFTAGAEVEVRVGDAVLRTDTTAGRGSFLPLGEIEIEELGKTTLTFTLLEAPDEKPLLKTLWWIGFEATK